MEKYIIQKTDGTEINEAIESQLTDETLKQKNLASSYKNNRDFERKLNARSTISTRSNSVIC